MSLFLFLWTLVACQVDEHPAPVLGSTYRIDKDVREEQSEIYLNIFTTDSECGNRIDDVEACRPRVDRSAGEVHLAFQFQDGRGQTLWTPLGIEQLQVLHNKSPQDDVELVPHNPRTAGQLFVLIIDGSSSMYENDGRRIREVYKALLRKDVMDAFFPKGNNKTGVLLMQFSNELRPLGGGEPRILRNRGAYKKLVKDHLLQPSGGFTHLYKAVRDGMTDLLRKKAVKEFIAARNAQPTFIVLTDGFNNEAASDTCATNATRLDATLRKIRKARTSNNVASTVRPVMFTVGLGKRYRPGDKPLGMNISPTKTNLCGAVADRRIDGDLETFGIDHVSLAWLAEAGGGVSFVKQRSNGLAEVFLRAAAKRYEWFEVTYKVSDPLYHRRSFDVRLDLLQGYRASTHVTLHPNPWFDAPSGTLDPGARWTRLTSLNHALSVIMPLLGLLVFINFLGPSIFNARRAVFRRGKPRRKK